MNAFKITEIVDADTLKVSPKWEIELKDNHAVSGNEIKIRGLNTSEKKEIIVDRLKKLLLTGDNEIQFNSPELIDGQDYENGVVSCSVYVSHTNILYYFPEFAYK